MPHTPTGLFGGVVVGSTHSTARVVPCGPDLPGSESQGKASPLAGLVAARHIVTQLSVPFCAFGLALSSLLGLDLFSLERLGDVPHSGI